MINEPDLRNKAGKLDPIKCLKFTRNAPLRDVEASNGAVASDEMLEIAETIVPGLVAEIVGREEDQMDLDAERTFDEAAKKHLSRMIKSFDKIEINAALQNITFVLPPLTGSRDDPIIIKATIPSDQWQHVPELASRLNQLKAARNND